MEIKRAKIDLWELVIDEEMSLYFNRLDNAQQVRTILECDDMLS